MKHDNDFETLLDEALGRRGERAPFSIDVVDRVMTRVAAMGVPARTEIDFRQFTRWAAAASLVGLGLLAAALWGGASLSGVISALGNAIASGTDAALKLSAPAASLAEKLGRVALALLASAQTLARPLAPLQPLAQALLAAITAAMLAITTFVVGRDVRRPVATKEHA
jgi:hypothetical protein